MALPGAFQAAIGAALPAAAIISEPEQLRTYECDALTGHRAVPELVVLPSTAEQVQEVVTTCHLHGVPFVARGAGTGLSGGALPVAEGIVISLARLDRVLEVDLDRARVVVEPGVTNLDITRVVAAAGFYYAPDPSSQQVCTIGGNVAENSGGAHCLKHGFTVNHVLSADVVLPDGELVTLSRDDEGPDLLGAFVGSEGTLGIAVRITVRVLRAPEAVRTLLAAFDSTDAAGEAVSHVIAAGILPAAVEMMDALTIEAAEAAVSAGYPAGAGAILIVDLDGPETQVAEDAAAVERLCRASGAFEMHAAHSPDERARIWRGRKSAFAAMGRISPSYYVQDGVVPRTRLPEVLRRIGELADGYGLRVANVFHAGDGNLHPLVLYDDRVDGEAGLAERLATEILDACIDAGGSLTGEHGVGVDKACSMPKLFGARDLETMLRLREALDPDGLANPGKAFPTPRLCGEVPGPYRAHPLERAGPPSVSEPATLEEAAEALRSASSISIERSGGEVVLSTARLGRVLEHEPGDLTAIVEAGLRLSDLQRRLEPHGQMLALDPPGDPTLGACLAGDLSGPRLHLYGTMRDLVLGVTVVLADGTIASSGGKVVKNVAGYDLGKLFAGSHGRLGLVARLALRLHPRPAAEATVVAETDDPRGLWLELQRSQLTPSAVDFLPPDRLALLFEGGEAAVAQQVAACPGGQTPDTAVWHESAAAQLAARSRAPFEWQACRLARPGPGIAYVDDAPRPWPPVAERVRAAFDPAGALV